MKATKVIKTNKDYEAALKRLQKIFDAKPNSAEGNEAELLVILIQDYERKNYAIDVTKIEIK